MEFKVEETVVLATVRNFSRKVEEAIDLIRKFRHVRLECERVSVQVYGTDTPLDLRNRWRQDYDFFGLTRVQRKSLYELCVVGENTASEAFEVTQIPVYIIQRYIKAKGWPIKSIPLGVLNL